MTQCQREAGPDYGAASHRYVQVVAVVEVELMVCACIAVGTSNRLTVIMRISFSYSQLTFPRPPNGLVEQEREDCLLQV